MAGNAGTSYHGLVDFTRVKLKKVVGMGRRGRVGGWGGGGGEEKGKTREVNWVFRLFVQP